VIALPLEEYEKRAIPRLAEIDNLTPRCKWEKFDHECDDITLTLRAKWKRLMDEQGRDEVAAGL
jgi:hypothetical protein